MQEMQDTIPGSGRSLGVGNGNPLQYSCLENSTENEAWQTPVHRVRRVRHGWEVDHEHVPSTLTFWRIFIINECWTLQKLILHQLRCFFLFFSVLTWCVTLTDLCIWSWWSFYEFGLLVLWEVLHLYSLWDWPDFLFSAIFIWFWHQGDGGLTVWTWECCFCNFPGEFQNDRC